MYWFTNVHLVFGRCFNFSCFNIWWWPFNMFAF
jgi:hypothetical protein